jgi:hypothetical protein
VYEEVVTIVERQISFQGQTSVDGLEEKFELNVVNKRFTQDGSVFGMEDGDLFLSHLIFV